MFQQLTPITRNLIIINAVLFVLSTYIYPELLYHLAAYFPTSPNFKSWQIITHMFMHGGWAHIMFNMFTLWSFGPVLERVMGANKYLLFYFACGLGSFVLFNVWNFYNISQVSQLLLEQGVNPAPVIEHSNIFTATNEYVNSLTPAGRQLFEHMVTPMLGASGAIFGVVTAFAVLFPDAKLFLMFIPVPVKAKYLLPVIIIGSIYLGISQISGDNVAHFAHLGGALVGYIWIKIWKKKQNTFI